MIFEISWSRVVKKSVVNVGSEGFNLDCRDAFRDLRNLPVDILSDQLLQGEELFVWRSLLVDWRFIVIGGDVSLVKILFLFLIEDVIGSCSEAKVASSMGHVHRKGVIVIK